MSRLASFAQIMSENSPNRLSLVRDVFLLQSLQVLGLGHAHTPYPIFNANNSVQSYQPRGSFLPANTPGRSALSLVQLGNDFEAQKLCLGISDFCLRTSDVSHTH